MPDDRGWRDALRFVDDVSALAERLVAEEARVAIDSAWPTWTGWSAANNRVSESPNNFPLDPPTRPDVPGALFALANDNLSEDIAALQRHVKPGLVAIGNAVPYARDVGFIENNGALIYEEASKAGAASGIRRVNDEWPRLKR